MVTALCYYFVYYEVQVFIYYLEIPYRMSVWNMGGGLLYIASSVENILDACLNFLKSIKTALKISIQIFHYSYGSESYRFRLFPKLKMWAQSWPYILKYIGGGFITWWPVSLVWLNIVLSLWINNICFLFHIIVIQSYYCMIQ